MVFVAGCIGSSTPTGNVAADTQPQSEMQHTSTPVGLEVGNQAPDFAVREASSGRIIKLSDLTAAGKPVVVEFGATWCPSCRRDHSESNKVYDNHANNVELLVVDLDLNEGPDQIQTFQERNGFKGTFAVGNQDILVKYQARSTTTKFAIDSNGVIIWKGIGVMDSNNWNQLFDALSA